MKPVTKSVVLLSSGLDSAVNLYKAKAEGTVLLALTFDYGQRAAKNEVECAKALCQELQVPHRVLKLDFIKELGKSSLTDESLHIPAGNLVQIDDHAVSTTTAKSVWVPNRNGIFLNIAAGFAESLGASYIVPGFNLEEAATFPDNTEGFLQALTSSFVFSTANHVQAICFTTAMIKTDIVKMGQQLGVNWKLTWPCYFSGPAWCGACESCQRAKRAFQMAGVNIAFNA